ncbi:MAG: hypothetical protein ABIN80_22450 [Dyadobacter sp.]|uniref:hypothetical protein n=1 Tax=Dyadobacter sp. TaxID=1914288 RepID=UPI0032640887
MTKALKTYLLTLCTLLLSGYGFLYANVLLNSTPDSSIKFLEKSTYLFFSPNPECEAPAIRLASSDQDRGVKICFEKNEEENDNTVSAKTSTDVNNFFAAFYNRVSGYFYSNKTTHLLLCKHWFYASSDRCIVLRVIRI